MVAPAAPYSFTENAPQGRAQPSRSGGTANRVLVFAFFASNGSGVRSQRLPRRRARRVGVASAVPALTPSCSPRFAELAPLRRVPLYAAVTAHSAKRLLRRRIAIRQTRGPRRYSCCRVVQACESAF